MTMEDAVAAVVCDEEEEEEEEEDADDIDLPLPSILLSPTLLDNAATEDLLYVAESGLLVLVDDENRTGG